MSNILKIKNVNDYSRCLGCKELHPLVCVIDYSEVSPIRYSLNDYSVYGLFLRDMPKWTWNTVVADMITTKEHCCAWGQVRLEARKIMENKS